MQGFEATPELIIGERFRLVKRIGSSPNADTWRARDRDNDDRPCVVKLLGGADLARVEQLNAFEREARVLDGLSHPGVPRPIAATTDARGIFILAIDEVDGLDLATHLRAGPRLGEPDLLQVARSVLEVLDYLHTRTPPVFHRDIKPSNIVRRPDGTAALVDFGAVCEGWRGDATVAVGTLGYMAPEQLHGHVTRRSDLYALGATLLHLATGRTPAECMDTQLGVLAIPPNVQLDLRLSRLIAACIQNAPAARPESAKAALALLDTPLPPNPAPKPPPPVPTPAPNAVNTELQVWNAFKVPPAPRDAHAPALRAQLVHFLAKSGSFSSTNGVAVALLPCIAFAITYAVSDNLATAAIVFFACLALWISVLVFTKTPTERAADNNDDPATRAFRTNPLIFARVVYLDPPGGYADSFSVKLSISTDKRTMDVTQTLPWEVARGWRAGELVPVLRAPDGQWVPMVDVSPKAWAKFSQYANR